MKKRVAWLLVVLMMVSMCAGASAQNVSTTTSIPVTTLERSEDTRGVQEGTTLTIGATSAMSGHFGTEFWGHNTADMDVRSILHGYNTVAWTRELSLAMNGTVLTSVTGVANSDGSQTYTLNLAQGLTYNDGTPITAKDYAFSLLLSGAQEIKAIGGTQAGLNHLVGYEAYMTGQTKTIAGVRLLSNTSFSLQISKEYLPFFYGLAMLDVRPYPISIIAPGCEVRDDGSGVYIAASTAASSMQGDGYTPGTFSADMLRVTLLDPYTGYEYNPQLTTGPYVLDSFDTNTHTASFAINEKFKGNYEGQKPHIESITFTLVENETMIEKLEQGEIDLINKVLQEEAVAKAQKVAIENQKAQMSSYPRTGLAFLSFACESGPASSEAVRKAIAMSLDIDSFVTSAAGNTARRVYGYYGMGQWMAFDVDETTGREMPTELAKLAVQRDIDAANKLLASDGWNLNESGRVFIQGSDQVRYRQGDAGLEPLTIKWAKMQGNSVADALEQSLVQAMQLIGVQLEVTELPFEELLKHYYRQESRTFDMFYLASNFTNVFDPYYDFNTADAYQGAVNKTGLRDEQLMNLARDLRETQPSDAAGYVTKWLVFQQRFVEVMPMIPLYSSIYFDLYDLDLRDYDITNHMGWGYAIPYAWIDEGAG